MWVLWWLLLAFPRASTLVAKTSLRVAFAYYTSPSDLGWTWRHNQGRIAMQTALARRYPSLRLTTYYTSFIPEVYPPLTSGSCPTIWSDWANDRMDIIVGTSFGHQFCMVDIVAQYPSTVFFHISGYLQPNVTNWGVGYARIYQPTYVAGMVAGLATQTGHVGAVFPIQTHETYRQLAAFAMGVARANASHTVHVGWTGDWLAPLNEILTTNRLADLSCDVIIQRTDDLQGAFQANSLDIYTIGFNTDPRMLVGETVLISPYFNWGVLYEYVAELVIWGNFSANTPMALFPGLEAGAVALSEPSFYVDKSWVAQVDPVLQSMVNGSWDPFCGPLVTNTGTVVGAEGHCSNYTELTTMMWEPSNVVDHGRYLLPSQACYPGEFATWHDHVLAFSCTACPGGTYATTVVTTSTSNVTCVLCGPATYAQPNSTQCRGCPPGTQPSVLQDVCDPCAVDTYSSTGVTCTPCPGALVSPRGASVCTSPPLDPATIIAAGVSVGIVALGVVVMLCLAYRRKTRAQKVLQHAPTGNVTIMFTDVQSSTLLWDKYPEAMALALEQHNRLIRERLTEHGGYEVKTIGDSFMVAFEDCNSAVVCAMDIQWDLVLEEWPEQMQDDPACMTEVDGRDKLIWRGLRVRMGISTGSPQTIVNRHTWRVDYFGPCVNLAARVETKACGGQTLVTDEVHASLSPAVRERYVYQSIGPQQYRGVSRPVETFSVLHEHLATRVFPEVKDNLCLKCQEPLCCVKCDPPPINSPRRRFPVKIGRNPRRSSLTSVVSSVTRITRQFSSAIPSP